MRGFVHRGWANLPPDERERLQVPSRRGGTGWLELLLGGGPDDPIRRGDLRRLWVARRRPGG